jgi:hypothetical protein
MQASKAGPSISAPVRDVVSTGVDTETPVTSDSGQESAARAAWQRIIDHQLIEWGRDPGQFDDEGIEPPTRETVQRAI